MLKTKINKNIYYLFSLQLSFAFIFVALTHRYTYLLDIIEYNKTLYTDADEIVCVHKTSLKLEPKNGLALKKQYI